MVIGLKKSASTEEKEELVKKAVDTVCDTFSQVAKVGKPGSEYFADFNKLMNNGGSMEGMSMGGDSEKLFKEACNYFTS
jgi:hypothetical protein